MSTGSFTRIIANVNRLDSIGPATTRAALKEWVRQKAIARGFAANKALLPSRDRPAHNLTETRAFVVNLSEFPRATGEFEIVGVRVGLHQEMKGAQRQMDCSKIWGTAFTVVRCIVGMEMIMQVHPTFIKKEAIEEKMKEDARTDWIDQFKLFANAEKMYQTPDGKTYHQPLVKNWHVFFSGIDGRECERFIRSIKSHAFAQQKQRDYEWMADLAATLLDGAALRWYSQLDEDVQGNWKLLEKALLAQYPAEVQESKENPPERCALVFGLASIL
ncbi:hypothetical protein M407DRAFT_21183 [Tulasnella calospora MUT 4182]|uniref:Retrotransposon gag domain-containing protein n=1 Tax=Tulasnella calospora MUT 4182 TaxID=1051891 RepID=A0A0C3M7V3_9AGAM|nr:hypothetical protein M407DRAFT_21183 [Tulasnella calospora MUT 4182]